MMGGSDVNSFYNQELTLSGGTGRHLPMLCANVQVVSASQVLWQWQNKNLV